MTLSLLVWWWVPVLSSVGFALLAPVVARRTPPRLATWMLSLGSCVLAAVSVALPSLLFLVLVGQWRPVAAMGHWSAHLLHAGVPVPAAVLVLAACVLAGQGLLLARAVWKHGRALATAWRLARTSAGALVVLPDASPTVFALPGWPGRIVAAAGLLRTLTPPQRRVVLAHEQAHLDGRHELHLAAVALAAAVNPFLARTRAAVSHATERWADERAAAVVGDRALVARTIGLVAAACTATPPAGVMTMGAAGPGAASRVEALLGPPTRRRPLLMAVLVVLALVPVGVAVHAAHETGALFERAEQAYGVAPSARV